MSWATRNGALAALRTRMQDDGSPQRYTEIEVGIALDHAVEELSSARPLWYVLAATAKIETSADGTNWMDTSIVGKTATGYFALEELHRFVRANVTAFTSGTVSVDLVQQV